MELAQELPRDCVKARGQGTTYSIRAVSSLMRRESRSKSLLIVAHSRGRPNVLTLSCKSRPPRRPRKAARRLPRPTRSGRSELQPT